MNTKDCLGDRMKEYEIAETGGKFMKGIPLLIRLDGRSFSRYTKKFNRPFDDDMSHAMIETTKMLVSETNALLGYTQSDEITLILYTDDHKSEMLFDGKKFKIISNLASLASVHFYKFLSQRKGDSMPVKLPSFDCRAFQVPTKMEAWNAMTWRVQDAMRNSVQSLAHSVFSDSQLHGKSQHEAIIMLYNQKKIVWGDLPAKYKEGSFIRTAKVLKPVNFDEIPANQVGNLKPGDMVERTVVQELELGGYFTTIQNREEFIFNKAPPLFHQQVEL